jgi:hypothetical protein
MKIKIFTSQFYAVQEEVNEWIEENEEKIEVLKIKQSSCYNSNFSSIFVTVMIEYLELEE